VASGEQRGPISLSRHAWSVAYAPDGRRIAVGGIEDSRQPKTEEEPYIPVELIDLVGMRTVAPLLGHEGTVYAVCFSPDSRTLASASGDTTALLWDVAAFDAARPRPLTPAQRAACWTDLAGDAREAYASMWKLADDPGTVDLLRKELRPLPMPAPPDATEFSRLLTELDNDQPAVRSKALQRLAEFGPAVEGQLRKALEGTLSAEARRSVAILLQSLEGKQRRGRRAVEVLEWANTAAARQLLETLAQGADDELTREAKETLERLRRRPVRGGSR
jgi:hypothetical protein